MNCECQDPSCFAHLERHRCEQVSIGNLSDDDNFSMDLCAECAASFTTMIETDPSLIWEKFND